MYDPMGGKMLGANQPMSSYAPNNALAGMQYGKMMPPGMMPQQGAPMPPQDPGMMTPQGGNALAAYGQAPPLAFAPGGMPQQHDAYRQQLQDWRGMRPERPDFGQMGPGMHTGGGFDPGSREPFRNRNMDWRGQMQDRREMRPQFAGWR